MKKTIFKSAVVLLTAIMTISCSKDGATGPAGATGAAGTNGINGNANVVGSTTVSVPPSNWTNNSNSTSWSTTLTWQAITQAIVDKGSVSVFFQLGTEWVALPYSNPQNHYFTNYGFALGMVEINISTETGYTLTSPGSNIFRVVAISASNKAANPNTNWNDYNQVKKALNIVD